MQQCVLWSELQSGAVLSLELEKAGGPVVSTAELAPTVKAEQIHSSSKCSAEQSWV